MNANAKYQAQADALFRLLGLDKVPEICQFFIKRDCSGNVFLIVIKIVEETLCSGSNEIVRQFATDFANVLTLGTVSHGSGRLMFSALNTIQHEDYTCTIEGDEKLSATSLYRL